MPSFLIESIPAKLFTLDIIMSASLAGLHVTQRRLWCQVESMQVLLYNDLACFSSCCECHSRSRDSPNTCWLWLNFVQALTSCHCLCFQSFLSFFSNNSGNHIRASGKGVFWHVNWNISEAFSAIKSVISFPSMS